MKTSLTELLQIKYPIIQGGMAWAATAELAAAVSEAGGLGIIGAGSAPPDVVKNEIKKVRERTDKPFGVNMIVQSPFADEIAELLVEEKVPIIATGGGNPAKFFPLFKKGKAIIMPVVSSSALAKRLVDKGANVIVAEGMESGGHIGEVSTMVLVPAVARAVKVPVVAAGGIADGRGLLAALALGAQGVQMGTRFMCSTECIAHPRVKEAILKTNERSTVVTGSLTGQPVRVLRNKLANEFKKMEEEKADIEKIKSLGAGKLRAAIIEGNVGEGSLMAGQVAGLIEEILPVKEIIEKTINEARLILAELSEKYLLNQLV